MEPALTDLLCTRCALCCDGTLFADVELAGHAEARRVEDLGLELEDGENGRASLSLPCVGLHGTRCSVYAYRPSRCRAFECRLLMDTRRGALEVPQAQAHIAEAVTLTKHARSLLRRLGRPDERLPIGERVAEALVAEQRVSPVMRRHRAELASTLAALEAVIRRRFLWIGVRRPPPPAPHRTRATIKK